MAAKNATSAILFESTVKNIEKSPFFADPIVRHVLHAYAVHGADLLDLDVVVPSTPEDVIVSNIETTFCGTAFNAREYVSHFYRKDLKSGQVSRDEVIASVRALTHDLDLRLLRKALDAPDDIRDHIIGALLSMAQLDVGTMTWSVDDAALRLMRVECGK